MAMTKAEMESHDVAYHGLLAQMRVALKEGLYHRAIQLALSSFQHIDGMMQYDRKYEDREFASVETIDTILTYAPVLLDSPSLDALESLLKGQKRIERDTSEDLGEKLAKARKLLWDAHRLWGHLEQYPQARQDELRQHLGGNQDQWRSVAQAWENIGLLQRTPEGNSYRLTLSTRMGEVVSGKCSSCAEVVEAPKAMFLETLACPKCEANVWFVILPKQ